MKNKRTGKQVVISALILVIWMALVTGPRRVLSATTFTVTNTGDNGGVNPAPGAGTGTLRQAIVDANTTAGADTIDFQAGLTGTITLASALPLITDGVTINGPAASALTVSGADLHQVFSFASSVTASISGLTISHGKAGGGSGIFNGGTLTISGLTISNGIGSGIFNSSGTLTITSSTISGNTATTTNFGGGIINQGTMTITNSTVSGNSAVVGGGIYNVGGTLTITSSTLSGNTATGTFGLSSGGGGIYSLGPVTVTNCTFSGNSAPSNQGGGINNDSIMSLVGTMKVANSTFSENFASAGGGIANAGTATFKNSIIANSPSGGNCSGSSAITAVGVNYSTDNTCGAGFTVVPSTGAGGLNLGPLQDNGGPTFTHALLAGSVAIDAVMDCTDLSAMPAPVTTDQRGKPRPADGDGNGSTLCDAGAFELQLCSLTCPAPITQSTDPNQCGAVVSYSAPTTSGDCFTVTCSPPSGSFFLKGTTTVNCDASGTTANPDCSFTVTVNDTQPPTITCPTNVTAVSAVACPPTTSTVVTFATPTGSDNCPGVTVACVPPSGATLPAGTTTVTCTATDSSGNTASCSFSVTVFNGRLQDDSNPKNVLLFNTTTGAYILCCGGTTFTGTGSVILKGCLFTLQQNTADRRLLVNVDFSLKRGTASLQFPPGVNKCTITDRNMMDDTSICP